MASQQPTPKHHDETTLIALEQALKDACQVLKAHDPDRDWAKDAEVQQALAEKLMDLVDTGVRDPRELCRRLLESFELDTPH
jgi:hypothetical protein